VLDQLELGPSMESLTFKFDAQRLAIHDLEKDSQVMLSHFFWIVEHIKVHLLTRFQTASSWLDLEDFLVQDFFLKRLFFTRCAWVSPGFHLNLRVVGHLKIPISLHSTHILERECDSARLRTILDRQFSEVPRELAQVIQQVIVASICLVGIVPSYLSLAQGKQKLFVHLRQLETFPQVCNADLVVAHVSESQQGVVSLAPNQNRCFFNVAANWLLDDTLGRLQFD